MLSRTDVTLSSGNVDTRADQINVVFCLRVVLCESREKRELFVIKLQLVCTLASLTDDVYLTFRGDVLEGNIRKKVSGGDKDGLVLGMLATESRCKIVLYN